MSFCTQLHSIDTKSKCPILYQWGTDSKDGYCTHSFLCIHILRLTLKSKEKIVGGNCFHIIDNKSRERFQFPPVLIDYDR